MILPQKIFADDDDQNVGIYTGAQSVVEEAAKAVRVVAVACVPR